MSLIQVNTTNENLQRGLSMRPARGLCLMSGDIGSLNIFLHSWFQIALHKFFEDCSANPPLERALRDPCHPLIGHKSGGTTFQHARPCYRFGHTSVERMAVVQQWKSLWTRNAEFRPRFS